MHSKNHRRLNSQVDDYYCLEKGSRGKEQIKILLVYPKVGSEAKEMSLHSPLSLLYLASYLKDYSIAIYDQRVDGIEKFQKLLAKKPICVGFSVMTGPQIKFSLELAELVKEYNIPTVFGGVHPSILPEQTKMDRRVDYVVVGEGELALRKLIDSLENGTQVDPIIRAEKIDLNSLSPLPYELIDVEKYIHSSAIEGRALPVLFSRGCPFACTFCCNPVITQRKWRTMNPDLAINQLMQLVDKYNLDSIIFWDENLTVNPNILNKFAASINGQFKWYAQSRINSLLKYDLEYLEKMGLWRLSCGIESGSPRMLEKIKKEETVEEYLEVNRRLAKTKISAWYNYIVGFPDETMDDLQMTIDLALQILDDNPNAVNSTFYLLVPYPGTEIGNLFAESDLMPNNYGEWSDFGRHNYDVKWHSPEMLKLYEKICFSSKFVGRKLSTLFPKNKELQVITNKMTEKWEKFDFYDEKEWNNLNDTGWRILQEMFGENAY